MALFETAEQVKTRLDRQHREFGSFINDFFNNITGRTSKELALKNYDLQNRIFEYQQQLNDKQMEREDTAYQRAVRDANAAGLSSLNVGTGASSSALSSGEAPQINDYSNDNFTRGLNLVNTLNNFQNNLIQQSMQLKKQNAEINKINAEAEAIDRENQYFDYTIDKRKNIFDNDYEDYMIKKNFNDKYGFFNNATDLDKYAILKNLSPEAFSETIASNSFSQLGIALGLIQDIGKQFSNNHTDSAKGLIKDLGTSINKGIADSIKGVSNNKIIPTENTINEIIPKVTPKLMTWKEKKEQKKAQKKYKKEHKF